jgi:sporulation protein YlmC with PRC-barrel domain
MRRSLLLCAILAFGCAPSTDQSADSVPPADTMPPPPPALSLAEVAGTWEGSVMTEASDSVIALQVINATADTSGWTIMVANAKTPTKMVNVPVTRVAAAGDSIIIETAPFESVLRAGQQVSLHTILRLQGGKAVSVMHATYPATNETVTLRGTANRKMAP